MKNNDSEETKIDLKGTFQNLVEAEKPELTQEEEIKLYKDPAHTIPSEIKGKNSANSNNKRKNNNSDDEDDESEDDEYLKKLKRELLASLERVNQLAKKIFGEKEKLDSKEFKTIQKLQKQRYKSQTKVQDQATVTNEKNKDSKGRSREE